ncbi:uncharacterized protein [Montipora capricornis]|uniref:uncharacterized protein n=1 Tax=Montipora capricornis TaxID=246305 RepID=UPI0035F16B99
MSTKLDVVLALMLLLLVVDGSNGTFCDQGPPGRYCFKDLRGWYECTIDSRTQQMTEKKHNCPPNTRCQCFYGPKCPSSVNDPCGSYSLPPPFPGVFSTFYTQIVKICDNKGCTNHTNIGELLQDAKAGLQRHDKIGLSWETTFIFPFTYIENRYFLQFNAAWFNRNCSVNSRASFPRFEVPSYFTCDNKGGTFKVCSWQSGGHSKTGKVTIEKWLLYDLPDGRYVPYYHEVEIRLTPSSNKTTFYETMYASFFPDFLDPSQLSMPSFCARDVTGYPVATPETKHMVNPPKIEPEMLEEIKSHGIAGFFKKLGLNDKE